MPSLLVQMGGMLFLADGMMQLYACGKFKLEGVCVYSKDTKERLRLLQLDQMDTIFYRAVTITLCDFGMYAREYVFM